MIGIKILQINSVCGIGSTGKIVADLYKVLEDHGHECIIAYGRENAPEGINTIKIGSELSVNVHGVLSRLTDRHGFYSSSATRKLISQIEAHNPDVIHLHNIHGYFINIALLFGYLKKANKPVIWTLHDCWAFTGHCAYFTYAKCDLWQTQCRDCPQTGTYPSSLFVDNSKNNYKRKKELLTGIENMTIVTPSQWLAGLVRKSFLNKYDIKVINNGIDIGVFKPTDGQKFRNANGLDDCFVILGVASVWEKRKGLEYFIELSKLIDKNTRIVLVGLDDKQLENLPQNVIGIKRTNSIAELVGIYSASDVFVNPTLEDNFPTTNLEALACGTPVITFNTGGSVECIDEKTGYVVETGNTDDLYDKILKVKVNGKLYYSEYCEKKARKLYDKDDKFKEYIDCYNAVLNTRL